MPTLGELKAAGYHGIRVFCRGCRRITIRWWTHFRVPPETDFAALQSRLRCRTCRARPGAEDVEPYYHDTAHVPARSAPPPVVEQPREGGADGD